MARKNTPENKHKHILGKSEEHGRHFTTISIKNYRCLKDFTIDSLERVNLIGGKNNIGKSSLLEIIFLLVGNTNISLILSINAFRGMEMFAGEAAAIRESLWSHLFHNLDSQASISIHGKLENGGQISTTLKELDRVSTILPFGGTPQVKADAGTSGGLAKALHLSYRDITNREYSVILQVGAKGINLPPSKAEPLFPGIFLSGRRRPSLQENAIRYGQLEMTKSLHYLLPVLKIIEPRLKQLSVIVGASGPMIYGDIGLPQMLPIAVMGDGLGGLASILLSISSAPGGVVLIDEIENGLHHSILMKVWQVIAEAARRHNTQIFATTHSWECIEAAHKAFLTNELYDFRFHRLQKIGDTDDTIEAVTLDQDELQTTIEMGWETR